MLNHQFINQIYGRVHRRLWTILFKSNFKSYGQKSAIMFPRMIHNAKYMEIGDHVLIKKGAWLIAQKFEEREPRLIIRGPVRIGYYVTISAVREVYIGQEINIAERVYISDNTHAYEDTGKPIWKQPVEYNGSVHIGDEAWIGVNACILGAKIGKHCVIGANSVVTKDIPDYCVALGSPARVVKKFDFQSNKWERVC